MGRSLHAWVDESIHVQGTEPGFYVLAASVGDWSNTEPVRELLRSLVFFGHSRLHWRDESPQRRRSITEAIAATDLTHLAVVANAQAARQERARRKCLERLLFELDHLDVGQVWLESRQTAQNRRDQEMVAALHGSGAVSSGLNTAFSRPLQEPMLWIPDAIAGMTNHARRTDDHTWPRQLGAAYRLIVL